MKNALKGLHARVGFFSTGFANLEEVTITRTKLTGKFGKYMKRLFQNSFFLSLI